MALRFAYKQAIRSRSYPLFNKKFPLLRRSLLYGVLFGFDDNACVSVLVTVWPTIDANLCGPDYAVRGALVHPQSHRVATFSGELLIEAGHHNMLFLSI